MSETFKMVDGDWVISNATGSTTMVADRVKLRQDIGELLSVAVQPTGFGTGLDDLIGQVTDPLVFRLEALRRIRAGVNTLQSLQTRATPPRLGSELVSYIDTLTMAPVNLGAGTDRTSFSFRLSVVTVSRDTVGLSGVVS